VIFVLNNQKCIQEISADPIASKPSETVLSDAMIDFQKRRQNLTKAREQLNLEREELENEKKIMEKYLENSEVIQFNVGGEIMFTTRATLLRVADSKMSKILLGKITDKISVDKDNNKFLDFNPTLFRHLLEQLRLLEPGEEAIFYPPLTPALTVQFNSMLGKLGLKPAPASDDDIFTFNVGDEIIATKRKTLNRVPDSKLSTLLSMNKPADMDPSGKPFLDYDPKLFRHLLTQLQAGQTTDFEPPSDETRAAYISMLNSLGLKHK
jgi:hypothetical protein